MQLKEDYCRKGLGLARSCGEHNKLSHSLGMCTKKRGEKTVQPRSSSLPAGAGVLRERREPALILTRTSKRLTSVCLRLVVAGKSFLPPHRGVLSSTSVLTATCRVPSDKLNRTCFLHPGPDGVDLL